MSQRTKPRSKAELLGEPIESTALDKIEAAVKLLGGEDGDTANGFAFYERYKDDLCYVAEIKTWLGYADSVWSPTDAAIQMQAFCADRVSEAAERFKRAGRDDRKESEFAIGHAAGMFNDQRKQERALKQARPHMTIPAAVFNRTAHLLGVRNGVLNLLTLELIQAPADAYISKRMGCDYDPAATAPMWSRFICDVLPDPDERDFFQRCVGAALFGDILDNGICFLLGETGDNGKSVACNVLTRLFGAYCMIAGADLLLQTKHDSETKRLYAGLSMGPRVVFINEIPTNAVWDDKKMKDVASRDDLQARKLYGEIYSFKPVHHVFVRGNHAPGTQDNGDAFWKRIWPVTFGVQIPKARQVAGLDDKIAAQELAGVLNWALEGAAAWRAAGGPSGSLGKLTLPASVREARERYRAKTDYLAQWLAECTEDDAKGAAKGELWGSYRSYVLASGMRSAGMDRAFFEQLRARGYPEGKSHGVRVIRGLRLIDEGFAG